MRTVADHLVTRLREVGVEHLFGVPGDFSLGLVEALTGPGRLTWVGTANELDAGYAADGYARLRGVGALCTTYGVGELSAINAVAGAYAEHVPLVHLTGAPATAVAAGPAVLHHTLGDADRDRFRRASAEVTAAAVVLTAQRPGEQVDAALTLALRARRPVHLVVPADLVLAPAGGAPAEVGAHSHDLAAPLDPDLPHDPAAVAAFAAAARALIDAGGGPALLVGHLVGRLGLVDPVGRLERAGWPVAELISAAGTLDGSRPGVLGRYTGALGTPEVRAGVSAARPLVTVGALLGDVVAGAFTHHPDPAQEIVLDLESAQVAGRRFTGVPLAAALTALVEIADRPEASVRRDAAGHRTCLGEKVSATDPRPDPGSDPGPSSNARRTGGTVSQAELWAAVGEWLPAHRTLVADIGTAFWGAVALPLPDDVRFVAQPVWSSIGYALPAALGAALAERDRPVVLVTGEGAAQMTAAELGLLARHAPGGVVLVLDNGGYTIERLLRSPTAAYHDVPRWDWPALATALAPGAPPVTTTVTTAAALRAALAATGSTGSADSTASGRLHVIVVRTAPDDAPPLLRALAATVTAPAAPGRSAPAGPGLTAGRG